MTFNDRAYGTLAGGLAGFMMGRPAYGLTRYEIKKKYDRITEIQADVGASENSHAVKLMDEAVVLAKVLVRDGRFDASIYKQELEASDSEQYAAEAAGHISSELFKAVPLGMKYTYDIPTCIDAAASMAELKDCSSPACAGACAIAAAVAAGVEGNCSIDDVIQLAFDSAVYGERRGTSGCGPSVSRRIKLAKKLVNDAEGAELSYVAGELTDVFGAEDRIYESVPFVLGIFYAVGGNAKKGIEEVVNAGGASDTNAALCGAVCGAFSGINALPADWSSRADVFSGAKLSDVSAKLVRRV